MSLVLPSLGTAVAGAQVRVAGTYGLQNEALQFGGTVRMQATVSQAAGGKKGSDLIIEERR